MTREERKELEKEEIENMIAYFLYNALDVNDEETISILEKKLNRIFKYEIDNIGLGIKFDEEDPQNKEKNDITLHLINYDENDENDENNNNDLNNEETDTNDKEEKGSAGGFLPSVDGKPYITINTKYFYDALSNEDEATRIFMTQYMIHALFHEIRHYQQYLLAIQSISSKETMMFARDYVMAAYTPQTYDENYYSYGIENDANLHATEMYMDLMGNDEYLYRSKILYDGELNTGKYKFKAKNIDTNEIFDYIEERDDVSDMILDTIICQEKIGEAFKLCPILLKEYNIDFTKKGALELIKNMQGEVDFLSRLDFLEDETREKMIKNAKEMYHDLIFRAFKTTSDQEFLQITNEIDKEELHNMLVEMKDEFNEERDKKILKAEKMWYARSRSEGMIPEMFYSEKNPFEQLMDFEEERNIYEERYKRKEETIDVLHAILCDFVEEQDIEDEKEIF